MNNKNKNKRSDLINLVLGLAILVLFNVLSQYFFHRFDLTAEKRYTLAETTKDMLQQLDDRVYFKVYLDGDFPQGAGDYKRLRDETRIMLDEFRAYGGDKIQYEFIDPNDDPDPEKRAKFQEQLESQGLLPQYPVLGDEGGTALTQQKIYPWAVATIGDKKVIIPLKHTSSAESGQEALNHDVESLEYEMSNAIRKLQMKEKAHIAITQGHGEPDTLELADLAHALREYYEVDFVNFHSNQDAFLDTMQKADQVRTKYSAVLVAGPDSTFTPYERFVLDQYIMYGGKALFLVDPVYVSVDSLAMTGHTMALPRKLGLEDMLFRYGARLNSTIVEDYYCANLVVPVGKQNQFMSLPWYYCPTIQPREQHPIVRNLDNIKFDFLSTVDTVETSPGVKKTILIKSSDKSRFLRTPQPLDLRMGMIKRDPRSFDKPDQPVAVLLEGSFNSLFKNQILPGKLAEVSQIGYKDHSLHESKIIVIGDGDVARNPVVRDQNGLRALKLGMDLLNRQNLDAQGQPRLYANKTLLVNCMNYLCDDKGMLTLRSREVRLRLLDKVKVRDHRLKWQMINILGPVLFVIVMGFVILFLRRRRYVQGKRGIDIYSIGFPALATWISAVIMAVLDYLFLHHSLGWAALVFFLALIILHSLHQVFVRRRKKKAAERNGTTG